MTEPHTSHDRGELNLVEDKVEKLLLGSWRTTAAVEMLERSRGYNLLSKVTIKPIYNLMHSRFDFYVIAIRGLGSCACRPCLNFTSPSINANVTQMAAAPHLPTS